MELTRNLRRISPDVTFSYEEAFRALVPGEFPAPSSTSRIETKMVIFMNSENFLLESSIKKACQSISESCGQGIRDFEDKVRATPLVAVSLGMLAGYLFPITLILGFVARLLLFSIKPLLLIFGAAKLYELIQQKRGNSWSPGDLSDRTARGTV